VSRPIVRLGSRAVVAGRASGPSAPSGSLIDSGLPLLWFVVQVGSTVRASGWWSMVA
jgi:hypothetical protein